MTSGGGGGATAFLSSAQPQRQKTASKANKVALDGRFMFFSFNSFERIPMDNEVRRDPDL
jgi:hypothetical protein